MRIIKEWNDQTWKYTMFYHNNRYTLKVENGSSEQVYKLADLADDPSSMIETLSSQEHYRQKIESIFTLQEQAKRELLSEIYSQQGEDEFDDII
jgi:hypothetical protein